ncbi:hypothetical protein K5I29_02040 [Flavobacterium agricola]|uniref:Uncharacterized protein n=1 Tax=Flavobacterium agricola TaxID=2870839 RepID=A0ABY6LZI0_9FLAO|nr:hypothetical protein [Flavobacterium agricola]UYW01728.1 hypothetical protein K5I29_02040 [Flavobacterium agricola]
MKKMIILCCCLFSLTTYSQVGIVTTTPKATLDIQAINPTGSSSQVDGILIPRVDRERAQNMENISTSTLVYVSDALSGEQIGKAIHINENGYYFFDGNVWQKLTQTSSKFNLGDIKYSALKIDHDGWYLLDGRQISTLTNVSKNNANLLGFTTNLPNANGRVIKQVSSKEVNTVGGNSTAKSISITRANIPNFTMSGTTSSNGAHTHTTTNNNYTTGAVNSSGFSSGGQTWATTSLVNSAFTINSAGAHTHTFSVSTGGSGTPISVNTEDEYLSANTFIYLFI